MEEVPNWHTPFASQQPEHVAGPHAGPHAPPASTFDGTQGAPDAPQSVHLPPPWPHAAVSVPRRHWVPMQHPAQFSGPHDGVVHCWPAHWRPVVAHDWHACPPDPQSVELVPA